MKRSIASIAAVAGFACASPAQTGVRYTLQPSSDVFEEFCLAPCLCPYHGFTAPVEGRFTLTFLQHGPLFDDYAISGVDWVASGPSGAIHFLGNGIYRIGGEVVNQHQMIL